MLDFLEENIFLFFMIDWQNENVLSFKNCVQG